MSATQLSVMDVVEIRVELPQESNNVKWRNIYLRSKDGQEVKVVAFFAHAGTPGDDLASRHLLDQRLEVMFQGSHRLEVVPTPEARQDPVPDTTVLSPEEMPMLGEERQQ